MSPKITFTDKGIKQAPKGYVRVVVVEGGKTRFVEKGGVETLEIGSKDWKSVNRRRFVVLCRSIITTAKQNKIKKIAVELSNSPFPQLSDIPLVELGSIIATAFVMANYEHNSFKSEPKDGWNDVKEVLICGKTPKDMRSGFKRGALIGESVNACRELSNMPAGDMTPSLLAEAAETAAQGTDVSVKTLSMSDMKRLGMGGVVGVGKGAEDEPKFIILEYRNGGSDKPIVLVGKGVTFDSGGLQAKPGDHMYEMHMDMSGGAAVIHSVILAAKLGLKANVIGLVPAVENTTGPGAMRPGDILKSLSGKTIEILHTDAEGRVILADALTYAKRYNPAVVADAATLTGAALTAFGEIANAFMTNREDMIPEFSQLAEQAGDYMWAMPLWEEYDYIVKGRFGDVPNIPAQGNTRYAGVIGGGKFLEVFAKELDCPWVHVDIAPRMTANSEEHLAKGAAGSPVRFFLALIEKYAQR